LFLLLVLSLFGCNTPPPREPIELVSPKLDALIERDCIIKARNQYIIGYVDGMRTQRRRDYLEVVDAMKSQEGLKKYLYTVGGKKNVLVGKDKNWKKIAKAEKNKIVRRKRHRRKNDI